MQTTLTGLAILLAVGAAVVAGYAITHERSDPVALEARLEALDARLARIEQSIATQAPPAVDGPSLVGRSPVPDPGSPVGLPEIRLPGSPVPVETAGVTESAADPEAAERLEALVDEAVSKKAAEIQQMQDKKPPIDAFAKILELTEEQRRVVEQEVLRGQREIQTILETPAGDGTVFMDDLVDILADSIAHPGERGGRWMKFIGRLMSEEYPGTSESYAERAEAVKATVKESFRREFTERQYATFEAWQMDPTEIKDVEYSPWKDVEARVIERAKEMGAEIPDAGN